MTRAESDSRTELVKRAQKLRAQGLTLREIGERLGRSKQTVHEYLTDPDRATVQARKASYSRPCPVCGESMDGSQGTERSPARCRACLQTNAAARDAAVASRWREGSTTSELAVELGIRPKQVTALLSNLRRRGYDVPYRRADKAAA